MSAATPNSITLKVSRFIDSLDDLARKHDRAAMSNLRNSLSSAPNAEILADEYVAPHAVDVGPRYAKAMYVVAGLYGRWRGARTSDDWSTHKGLRFGEAMRIVMTGESNNVKETSKITFRRICNSDPEQLRAHLQQAVSRCSSRNIFLDWASLVHDIAKWGEGPFDVTDERSEHPSRKWARDFWNVPNGNIPAADTGTTPENGDHLK